MPTTRTFGRRPERRPAFYPSVRKTFAEVERHEPAPLRIVPAELAPVENALDMRASSVSQDVRPESATQRFRWWSLREPWRSVSIVAGLGFVATSWMLPEDVATVSQIALGVLTLGSFYAAWRWRKAA